MSVGTGALLAGTVLFLQGKPGDATLSPKTTPPSETPVLAPLPPPESPPDPRLGRPPVAPSPSSAPDRSEKTTPLPTGGVLIENKKAWLKYADGRVEERLVKIKATPTRKPLRAYQRFKNEPSKPMPSAKAEPQVLEKGD